MLMNCWGGFKHAQASRIAKLPRREGYPAPPARLRHRSAAIGSAEIVASPSIRFRLERFAPTADSVPCRHSASIAVDKLL